MKYLKTYEEVNITPQKGDYVVINTKKLISEQLIFLENKIGRITGYTTWSSGGKYDKTDYNIKFKVKEKNIMSGISSWDFEQKDFLSFSKNKEELKIKLSEIKYNL